ncbi:MAG: hypothetical protein PUE95_03805 [Lachnospiraceae bacterium]|nr:hypothetical protein [Lachnospiraceae bacterium]
MQKQRFSREEFLEMFTQDVIRLSKYIPWLEEKSGADVSKYYEDGEKMAHTLSFPVYDSILLAFLNDASTTVFMEQNYQYFYTRNHIQSYVDELALIEKADIMHMDILQCILSRYVFGGMVKAYLWKDGVEHQIFVNILKKARQIVEFWSEPLIIEDEIPAEGYPEEEEFTYPDVDEADWTDEEFAAVLAGELDPNDIPRLRWEKEHGTTAAGGAVASNVPEVVLPFDYEFPPVDDEDWTDEEFAAVLAGELDPNDIPKLHYERENGVVVVFALPDEMPTVEEPVGDNAEGSVSVSTEPLSDIQEVVLPFGYEFPPVDDEDWTDEEFAAVLAGELDPDDIPRLHYERENGVVVVFASEEEIAETEGATEMTEVEEPAEEVVEEPEVEELVEESEVEEELGEESEGELVEEEPTGEPEEKLLEEASEEPLEEASEEPLAESETESAETIDEPIEETVEHLEELIEELVAEVPDAQEETSEEAVEENVTEDTVEESEEELAEESAEESKAEDTVEESTEEPEVEESEEETTEETVEETAEELCDDEETESEE